MIWDGDVDLAPMMWRVEDAVEGFARRHRSESGRKLDANETNFVARSLLHIMARVQEVKYSKLIARQAFPQAPVAGSGLESIGYHQLDYTGEMGLIGSGSTDSPEVASSLNEFTYPVGKYAAHYKWTHQDLEKAMRANVPLSARKAMAARKAAEQKVENVAFFGDTVNTNIKGLFSNTLTSVTSGVTGSWASATDAQILRDVELAIEGAMAADGDTLDDPDSIIVSEAVYGLLCRTRTNTDWSIKNAVMENFGIRNIYKSARLNSMTNSTNSISAENVLLVYKQDPEIMELQIAREFEQLPVERTGLEYRVECLMDYAGMFVYHPLSVAFIKGL